MFDVLRNAWQYRVASMSRRELVRRGSLLSVPGLVGAAVPARSAASAASLELGGDIYESIGVRPLINCRGTFTIISGSLMLPEVRNAVQAAAQRYVHIDELHEAIGARLAELTKAEWGLVSSGCSAALSLATAACVAGGNPELHVRIPNLRGFAKDEVIIPRHSRNVYDAALRAVGVRVVEAETADELEAAFGPRTAMIYILAGRRAETGPLAFDVVAKLAARRNVPILVDAAAEVLTVPNVHLERGASLVAYSGGKCLRGPQTAGLLLGRKDLVRAAWVHSAPHHGFARAMKVGKEEAIGMLMAVEMWMKRDHEAEWDTWRGWLDLIDKRVSQVEGVSTTVREPPAEQLSNRSPSLRISWDESHIGIGGRDVARQLLEGEPRIAVSGGRRGRRNTGGAGISITPYMMSPGDATVVADRIYDILSSVTSAKPALPVESPAVDLSGAWKVHIQFSASASDHVLHLRQHANRIEGSHQGELTARDVFGSISNDSVTLSSFSSGQRGDSVRYRFSGKASSDAMSGTLDMGEYLSAKWTAERRVSRRF